ncbi:MAG TPA: FkbM family methyltransferase [Mucilaginibacter sp.]
MKSYVKKLIKKYYRDPRRNKKGVFVYYGQNLYFPKDSMIFNRAMSEGGVYERENLVLIESYLPPDSTFLDIGANIGMMAIPLLWDKRALKVISVEASPNSLTYLKKTHSDSPFNDRWTIVDKAVADKPGVLDFHLSADANGAFDGLRNTERVQMINIVKVESTTIDHIWEEAKKPRISFIKIDIEGAELLALKGGIACINDCRPLILMEWNQTNIKAFGLSNYDLINFLKEIGYEIYYLPETKRVTSVVEMNLLCKKQFIENYLLVPAEKKD